jgi:DNA-binding CsgD family transcriptional regulator
MSETNCFVAKPVGSCHAILNAIRDPLNITDSNYRLLWANQAKARFHEQNLRDMIGRFCHEVFRRRSEPCPRCPVRAVFDSGKPCILERSFVLPNGSRKRCNVRCYPVIDHQGSVAYAIQVMIDTTKRTRNTERQKRHVEFLETTLREINGENICSFMKYEGGRVEKKFTEREVEVLGLIANGLSNVEIGKVLSISPHTVKSHLKNIFGKFEVNDRTQAATLAVRKKLI